MNVFFSPYALVCVFFFSVRMHLCVFFLGAYALVCVYCTGPFSLTLFELRTAAMVQLLQIC